MLVLKTDIIKAIKQPVALYKALQEVAHKMATKHPNVSREQFPKKLNQFIKNNNEYIFEHNDYTVRVYTNNNYAIAEVLRVSSGVGRNNSDSNKSKVMEQSKVKM